MCCDTTMCGAQGERCRFVVCASGVGHVAGQFDFAIRGIKSADVMWWRP
jgi:hypothetical protein